MLLAFTQQHNSPADCARELFKPSKDAASLPVPIKKIGSLDLVFLQVMA